MAPEWDMGWDGGAEVFLGLAGQIWFRSMSSSCCSMSMSDFLFQPAYSTVTSPIHHRLVSDHT